MLDRVPPKVRAFGQNYFDNQYQKQAQQLGLLKPQKTGRQVHWVFDDPDDDTNEDEKQNSNSLSMSQDFVEIVK